jgi:CRP-like cAMP-binding protein
MDQSMYAKVLGTIPLFRALTPDEVAEVLAISKLVRVPGAAVLIREGDPGDAMYMLVGGKVAVDRSLPKGAGVTRLAELTAPSVFGEMALIDGAPRSATVTTLGEAVVLRVDLRAFNELRAAFRPAVYKIFRELAATLCQRIEEKTEKVMQFYADPEGTMKELERIFLERTSPGGR